MLAANRRRSERHLCRRAAKIQFGTGSLPRDCTITDLSNGGAKVIAEYLDIPAELLLVRKREFDTNELDHVEKAAIPNAGHSDGSALYNC